MGTIIGIILTILILFFVFKLSFYKIIEDGVISERIIEIRDVYERDRNEGIRLYDEYVEMLRVDADEIYGNLEEYNNLSFKYTVDNYQVHTYYTKANFNNFDLRGYQAAIRNLHNSTLCRTIIQAELKSFNRHISEVKKLIKIEERENATSILRELLEKNEFYHKQRKAQNQFIKDRRDELS